MESQRHTGRRWLVTMEAEIGMMLPSVSQGTRALSANNPKLEEARKDPPL